MNNYLLSFSTRRTVASLLFSGILLLGFNQTSYAQIPDGNLENVDPFVNWPSQFETDFTLKPQTNLSSSGQYRWINNMQTFYSSTAQQGRFDHTTMVSDGMMLVYDGFDDASNEPHLVWSYESNLSSGLSYEFSFFGRNRFDNPTFTSFGLTTNTPVHLQLQVNGVVVDDFFILGQNLWQDFNASFLGQGNTKIELFQMNDMEHSRDFALDDFSLVGCELNCTKPDPKLSTNGSNSYHITACSGQDVYVKATSNTNCDEVNHFFGIRNLNSGAENNTWLTAAEAQQILGGTLNLNTFASSSHTNNWTGSSTFTLQPGNCYEIKYVAQTDCFVWLAVVQEVCILEEEVCNCSIESSFTRESNDGEQFFSPNSTNGGNANVVITQYSMDFGDGSPVEWSSNSTSFSHNYGPGAFVACLTTYGINRITGECCTDTYCETVLIFVVVGGEFRLAPGNNGQQQNAFGDEVKLIPNPTDGNTKLVLILGEEVANAEIKLIDQAGRTVRMLIESSLLPSGTNSIDINGEDLAPGIYFIEVNLDGKSDTRKMLVH